MGYIQQYGSVSGYWINKNKTQMITWNLLEERKVISIENNAV